MMGINFTYQDIVSSKDSVSDVVEIKNNLMRCYLIDGLNNGSGVSGNNVVRSNSLFYFWCYKCWRV